MFHTDEAVWIAKTFTFCSSVCKSEFLQCRSDLIRPHLVLLGVDIPEAREALVKLAATIL